MFTFWWDMFNGMYYLHLYEDGISLHTFVADSIDIAFLRMDAFIDGRTE